MEKQNIVLNKSYQFAIDIVKLAQGLQKEKEYVLSRQILKSGTAICALIKESKFAQSKPDFINKLSISLKEANETEYWLNLLKDTDYISEEIFKELNFTINEIISLLVKSINTLKKIKKRKLIQRPDSLLLMMKFIKMKRKPITILKMENAMPFI